MEIERKFVGFGGDGRHWKLRKTLNDSAMLKGLRNFVWEFRDLWSFRFGLKRSSSYWRIYKSFLGD